MLDKLVHNRWPRVGAALFGSLLLALSINLFIVPQHLYTSGLLGLCQVIRTLLDTKLGIRFSNFDLAGTLYLNVCFTLVGTCRCCCWPTRPWAGPSW